MAKLTVALGGEVHPSVVAPHLGLIWGPPFEEGAENPPLLTESMLLSTSLEQVQLPVFLEPPPGAILVEDGLKISIGAIVAFDDRDGDGTFAIDSEGIAAPDLLFGINTTELLIYLQASPDSQVVSDLFANPEAFAPGLSRARIDLCSGKLEFVPMAAPIVLEIFEPSPSFDLVEEPTCDAEDSL